MTEFEGTTLVVVDMVGNNNNNNHNHGGDGTDMPNISLDSAIDLMLIDEENCHHRQQQQQQHHHHQQYHHNCAARQSTATMAREELSDYHRDHYHHQAHTVANCAKTTRTPKAEQVDASSVHLSTCSTPHRSMTNMAMTNTSSAEAAAAASIVGGGRANLAPTVAATCKGQQQLAKQLVKPVSPVSALLMRQQQQQLHSGQQHRQTHQLVFTSITSTAATTTTTTTPSTSSSPCLSSKVHPTTMAENSSSGTPRSSNTLVRSSRSFAGFDCNKPPTLADSSGSSRYIVSSGGGLSTTTEKTTAAATTTTPTAAATTSTTADHLRTNVTVTRRKSASEQLAESKSRYIRAHPRQLSTPAATTTTTTPPSTSNEDDHHDETPTTTPTMSNMKLFPPCPQQHHPTVVTGPETVSTRSASSRTSSLGQQQQQQQQQPPAQRDFSPLVFQQSHPNLVDKINIELNRSRLLHLNVNAATIPSASPTTITSTSQRKRVSPRLSEGYCSGAGTPNSVSTNLELQLRELIALDTAVTATEADELMLCSSLDDNKVPKQCQRLRTKDVDPEEIRLQKEKEANDIYRAELKFIASSSSSSSSAKSETESLSSMYDSEPRHSSLSPIDPNKNDSSDYTDSYNMVTEHSGTLGDHCLASALSKCSLAPPDEVDGGGEAEPSSAAMVAVVTRSKSDVSGQKNALSANRFGSRSDKGRFLQTNNSNYDADGENDSYQRRKEITKLTSHKVATTTTTTTAGAVATTTKAFDGVLKAASQDLDEYMATMRPRASSFSSSDSQELSSLSSSQLSLDGRPKLGDANQTSLSKSTSKLTFENLMLHQQSLMPSRSCHNLVSTFQTGPSVVERNARIIKWLFNCRKAMLETSPEQTITPITSIP